MKCILCGKEAKYTTFWDSPSPLCEDCAKIEAHKIWEKFGDSNFVLEEYYDLIVEEDKDIIYASSINTKTGEYE